MACSNLFHFSPLRKLACLTILFTLVAGSGYAQSGMKGRRGIGIAAKGVLPMQDFKDAVDAGVGLGIATQNRFAENVALNAEFSWHRMAGKSTTVSGQDISLNNIDFTGVQLGIRFYLGEMIFVGADGGYFSGGDINNEWGLLPSAGINLGNFDIIANYKFLNDLNFLGVRVAWYIFSWGT